MKNIFGKSFRRKIKYGILYGFVVTLLQIARLIPRRLWLSMCGLAGRSLFFLVPKLRFRIIRNLLLAYHGEKTKVEIRKLAADVLTMIAKNAATVIKGFHSSPEEFRNYCFITGDENAEKAYRRGQGVIFLTAHLGPFESVATDLSLKGYKPLIIGSPLKDPRLNELVYKQRTKFGAELIERGKETFKVMKNIGSGGTMAILIDQNTRVKSIEAKFFGRPCPTPIGATMLALKTGAAVVPVFAHLREDGFEEIVYYPEVELEKTGNPEKDLYINTQKFNDIIEKEVRKYPSQWVWMHERWRTA
jgi:Kdo2-lipid IVA lauroyltransferase/acyltransferase